MWARSYPKTPPASIFEGSTSGMEPTSQIEIDLSVLEANLAAWRAAINPDCELCPVIKADAYGLGAVPIARRLVAAGITRLAVYSLAQATAIAATGLPVSILVLMPVDVISRTDILYRSLVAGRLELAVHSTDQLLRIEALGRMFGTPIPVHFEIDTGMSRGGMSIAQADDLLAALPVHRYTKIVGIFTHPTCADSDAIATADQFNRFEALLRRHASHLSPEVKAHFANTPAALRSPRYHQGMVRLGLGLLGYGVDELAADSELANPPTINPIMRWTSSIVHQLEVPEGATVGYHATHITDRPTRLGVVPVGYGDGYPVSLSNVGIVRVGESLTPAPVRGLVNMDQITIDLTDIPSAAVGDSVELIAADPTAPNALPAVARHAGSSCYEILCRLSSRLQRRYVTTNAETGQVGHVMTV